MGDFDKELKDVLLGEGYYNGRRAEALKQEQLAKLDKKLQWAKWLTWLTIAACVLYGLYAYSEFKRGTELHIVVGNAVLILIMYESTILMKLWYWIVHTRVNVQKDVKEMQLQLAELAVAIRAREGKGGSAPQAPDGDAS